MLTDLFGKRTALHGVCASVNSCEATAANYLSLLFDCKKGVLHALATAHSPDPLCSFAQGYAERNTDAEKTARAAVAAVGGIDYLYSQQRECVRERESVRAT